MQEYEAAADSTSSSLGKLPSFPVDLDTLKPLFSHYEIQLADDFMDEAIDGAVAELQIKLPDDTADFRISLERAIACLRKTCLNTQMLVARDKGVAAIAEKQLKYVPWLQKWDAKFSAFLSINCRSMGCRTRQGCQVLKMHHLAAEIIASVSSDHAWSSFTSHFKAIIDLAIDVLGPELLRRRPSRAPSHPHLWQTVGITEPLLITAARCTDPGIQQEAQRLLTLLPKWEGAWERKTAAMIEEALKAATGTHLLANNW